MAYQMYRTTTLGVALQKALDEFIQEGLITPQLAMKVLTTFDKAVNKALQVRVKNKVTFRADKLTTYRFCDNVWTFVMEGVDFREASNAFGERVDRVKFVACDGRSTALGLPPP